jgi:hypothetical protein
VNTSLKMPSPNISDLHGLWTRSLIAWPDATRDTTTQVRWLQGHSAYCDLRQPVPMPSLSHVNGLAALTTDDCLHLANQEGFAGHFTFDGAFFEWARDIDYQPKPLYSDAGSLHWQDDILVETGRDIAYIEHWHRDPAETAAPAASVALSCRNTGVNGRFLRVGAYFMFARDRAQTPAALQHLTDCVAGSADIKAAQDLVDCEISFGVVGPAGYRITASTLPFRIGDTLDQHFTENGLIVQDRAADGAFIRRHWDVTHCEGDLSVLATSTLVHEGNE